MDRFTHTLWLWVRVTLPNLSHVSVAAAFASAKSFCGMIGLSWCPGRQLRGQTDHMGRNTGRGGDSPKRDRRRLERETHTHTEKETQERKG